MQAVFGILDTLAYVARFTHRLTCQRDKLTPLAVVPYRLAIAVNACRRRFDIAQVCDVGHAAHLLKHPGTAQPLHKVHKVNALTLQSHFLHDLECDLMGLLVEVIWPDKAAHMGDNARLYQNGP